MKRFINIKREGNNYTIINVGLDSGLSDITGNVLNYDTYESYVLDGNTGNRIVFDFVKNGGTIENISNSLYVDIVNNIPTWKQGVESELLNQLNEEIRKQRAFRYQNEVDCYTLKYKRKEICNEIDELTANELKIIIKQIQEIIKAELPYYTEVILF